MRSAELRAFEARYWELRRRFLPRYFSKTGSYSIEHYTDAAAFRVLFHSELESLLEHWALKLISRLNILVRQGQNCRASASILCLYKPEIMGGAPRQFAEIDQDAFIKRVQLACIHELKRRVEGNQGAKAHNLLNMFLPLGVDETVIEEQLFIDLNTLGARRGDVAHNAIGALRLLPDPREEKILAERILKSLAVFEQQFALCMA